MWQTTLEIVKETTKQKVGWLFLVLHHKVRWRTSYTEVYIHTYIIVKLLTTCTNLKVGLSIEAGCGDVTGAIGTIWR